ncbi:hypothetical protein MmiEs2_06340 [Methanimicrococcus stummii]|uniref:Uncharacterized protein n=1 Tax=Methanimicrococcus stummii TaxID=3028294 RepID=A0AA97A7W6_9EURY|nr:hypothetical protein MmiEs2_06340 [Methanimicrococcus sp. Es2]
MKKTRKYFKKLNKILRQKETRAEKKIKPIPFYSIFAAVRVQKEKKSAFLMLGNDLSNKELPEEFKVETDELTVNTNVSVKIKKWH